MRRRGVALPPTSTFVNAGRSPVLCLPLVKHGALVALLYLENKLASSVFTPAQA